METSRKEANIAGHRPRFYYYWTFLLFILYLLLLLLLSFFSLCTVYAPCGLAQISLFTDLFCVIMTIKLYSILFFYSILIDYMTLPSF